MLLRSAFEKEKFITCELLSRGVVCSWHSINVLSFFSHYSFQGPVLCASENSNGEKMESGRGCSGGRSHGSFGRQKHPIQPCSLLIPTRNDRASCAEGVSHAAEPAALPSCPAPICTPGLGRGTSLRSHVSRSRPGNVCLVSSAHPGLHRTASLMRGEFLSYIRPPRYILGHLEREWC